MWRPIMLRRGSSLPSWVMMVCLKYTGVCYMSFVQNVQELPVSLVLKSLLSLGRERPALAPVQENGNHQQLDLSLNFLGQLMLLQFQMGFSLVMTEEACFWT